MTELDAAVEALLAGCRTGEDLEVYGLHRLTTRIDAVADGELRWVGRAETRGLGVRLVSAERTGYASTTDLGPAGLRAVLAAARSAARLAGRDLGSRLPDSALHARAVSGCSPSLADTPLDDKVALTVDLARRCSTADPRIRTDLASYQEERATVTIASSRGVRARHERGWAELEIVTVGDDARGSATGYGHRWKLSPQELDVAAVAEEAVRSAADLLGPRQVLPTGLPVLFAPEVTAAVVAAIGRAFSGPALAGRGPFAGLSGRSVAAPTVTLVDDGLCVSSPNAAPFDDEGVPRQLTPLITDGLAVGALHSAGTAPPGQRSTGNARRGSHRSLPVVAPTTLRLLPVGDVQPAEAVHVRQMSGEGAGFRPVTGSVDVALIGNLVRNGAPAGPLGPVPCSTTLSELLRQLTAVGEDARVVSGSPVLAPTVMLCPGLL